MQMAFSRAAAFLSEPESAEQQAEPSQSTSSSSQPIAPSLPLATDSPNSQNDFLLSDIPTNEPRQATGRV